MERDQNESALRQTRMGNYQAWLADDQIAEKQNVQIEGARTIGDAGCSISSKFLFDCEEPIQQGLRVEDCFEGDNGIDEARLVGKSYRLSGVKRRSTRNVAQRFKSGSGGCQC